MILKNPLICCEDVDSGSMCLFNVWLCYTSILTIWFWSVLNLFSPFWAFWSTVSGQRSIHAAIYRIICLDHLNNTLVIIWTVTVFNTCRFFLWLCFYFLFCFCWFYATLVCHVAIALCNISSTRTGERNDLDVMSLNSLIVFPLVLSDLGVTKPLLLSHAKRVSRWLFWWVSK